MIFENGEAIVNLNEDVEKVKADQTVSTTLLKITKLLIFGGIKNWLVKTLKKLLEMSSPSIFHCSD